MPIIYPTGLIVQATSYVKKLSGDGWNKTSRIRFK